MKVDLLSKQFRLLTSFAEGVQQNYIIKMQSELQNVERLSNRIETIKDTTCLRSASDTMRFFVEMVLTKIRFVEVGLSYLISYIDM